MRFSCTTLAVVASAGAAGGLDGAAGTPGGVDGADEEGVDGAAGCVAVCRLLGLAFSGAMSHHGISTIDFAAGGGLQGAG